jgi:two-component system, OmpR family, response regulator
MRILLVEDDTRIGRDVERALTANGYVVDRSSDGEDALFRGENETFDGAILDLGLPGLDGMTILKRWRSAGIRLPVVVLTARGRWMERVEGIDAGADDYLSKPFEMDELLARLRAVLRRTAGAAMPVHQHGPLSIDTRNMRVEIQGEAVAVTPLEYRLLSLLLHNRGRAVSQREITEHLYSQDFERDSNSIEVLVGRLRRKLKCDLIETRRGYGYLIPESLP